MKGFCIKNDRNVGSNPREMGLSSSQRERFNLIESRTKGAILRYKTKWYNEGEKNTKYFLNLEKRHFKQGTISQVKINDNKFVTSDEKILSECELFYKNLYTSKHKASNDHDTTVFSSMETTMSFMTTNRRHVKGR